MYVTEDTTRAKPEALKALYGAAIDCGATRICLADTVGHATPDGVKALVQFVKREIVKQTRVKIDGTGTAPRPRADQLSRAIEAGVDRVHGTALGVGSGWERRAGPPDREPEAAGRASHDISKLPQYCRLVADAMGVPIAVNYPVMGEDAFRTGTGVHAAAIIKAKKKGHAWLADRVYSSVPAQEFGLEQKIEISPVSGLSNVKYWLETHGYDPEDEAACRALFEAANAPTACCRRRVPPAAQAGGMAVAPFGRSSGPILICGAPRSRRRDASGGEDVRRPLRALQSERSRSAPRRAQVHRRRARRNHHRPAGRRDRSHGALGGGGG